MQRMRKPRLGLARVVIAIILFASGCGSVRQLQEQKMFERAGMAHTVKNFAFAELDDLKYRGMYTELRIRKEHPRIGKFVRKFQEKMDALTEQRKELDKMARMAKTLIAEEEMMQNAPREFGRKERYRTLVRSKK
ncbi:MAG: hypothetical protein Q7R47_01825 [Candidatus Diapherotrites archaeon]|nr:hypothetical protein [Candidatus Diapherotrites archaeon]